MCIRWKSPLRLRLPLENFARNIGLLKKPHQRDSCIIRETPQCLVQATGGAAARTRRARRSGACRSGSTTRRRSISVPWTSRGFRTKMTRTSRRRTAPRSTGKHKRYAYAYALRLRLSPLPSQTQRRPPAAAARRPLSALPPPRPAARRRARERTSRPRAVSSVAP